MLTASEQKELESLRSYVLALDDLIEENDLGEPDPTAGEFDDEKWETWVSNFVGWFMGVMADKDKIGSPHDANWRFEMETWREAANGWWSLARRSGRIRRPKDADLGVPADDVPPVKPPIKKPPTGGGKTIPKAKEREPINNRREPQRSKPWTGLLIVLSGLAAAIVAGRRR